MFSKYFIILSVVIRIIFMEDSCENGKCPHILDGEFTTIENFPHSVFLYRFHAGRGSICGGSVLTDRLICTAAHCVPGNKQVPETFLVVAGHEDFTRAKIKRNVSEYIVHECYNETDFLRNDIALLFLDEKLPLGPTIKRVVITRDFPFGVKKGQVAGWGSTKASVLNFTTLNVDTEDPGTFSYILKYVEIKIYSQRKCCKICRRLGELTNYTGIWKPGIMCVGDRHAIQFKNQVLPGDSGGALVVSGNHQIGLASSVTKKKGVTLFTNVTYYYDWILTQAKKLYRKNHLSFNENTILTTVPPK